MIVSHFTLYLKLLTVGIGGKKTQRAFAATAKSDPFSMEADVFLLGRDLSAFEFYAEETEIFQEHLITLSLSQWKTTVEDGTK
jgi:hypothetical protein